MAKYRYDLKLIGDSEITHSTISEDPNYEMKIPKNWGYQDDKWLTQSSLDKINAILGDRNKSVIESDDSREENGIEEVHISKNYEVVKTDITSEEDQKSLNQEKRKFLKDTDWLVLRHRDQVDSGSPLSMTETEYLQLLDDRLSRS